jgi:hypothetical protein
MIRGEPYEFGRITNSLSGNPTISMVLGMVNILYAPFTTLEANGKFFLAKDEWILAEIDQSEYWLTEGRFSKLDFKVSNKNTVTISSGRFEECLEWISTTIQSKWGVIDNGIWWETIFAFEDYRDAILFKLTF